MSSGFTWPATSEDSPRAYDDSRCSSSHHYSVSLPSSSRTPAFPTRLYTLRCYLCTAISSPVSIGFAIASINYSEPLLTISSDAVHVLRHLRHSLLESPRPRLLPPLDLRRVRKCQFLLRHHSCLELGSLYSIGRQHFLRPTGRVGARPPRSPGCRSQTSVIYIHPAFLLHRYKRLHFIQSNNPKQKRIHHFNRFDKISYSDSFTVPFRNILGCGEFSSTS